MGERIVIIGGGFGGVEAALTLASLLGGTGSVIVVDRGKSHAFIPSIHEVSSGKIAASSIEIPFTSLFPPAGVAFVQGLVTGIDRVDRLVILNDRSLPYDRLLIATGAESHYFAIPGAEEHAYSFRSPADAERIHQDLVALLAGHPRPLRIVIAGGGTEGVEVAGEVLDLVGDEGYGDDLAAGRLSVTLVEGKEALLPGFPEAAREFTEQYLRGRGATIATRSRICGVRDAAIVLEQEREVPCTMLLWTGGIRPSRLIRELDLPKDGQGWLLVNSELRSPADERVHGIGDAVTVEGFPHLQRLAYLAQDEAACAAGNIAARVQGRGPCLFAPRSKPRLISIGRDMGIYASGGSFRTGSWVVALKKAVERRHLLGCLSRAAYLRLRTRRK